MLKFKEFGRSWEVRKFEVFGLGNTQTGLLFDNNIRVVNASFETWKFSWFLSFEVILFEKFQNF